RGTKPAHRSSTPPPPDPRRGPPARRCWRCVPRSVSMSSMGSSGWTLISATDGARSGWRRFPSARANRLPCAVDAPLRMMPAVSFANLLVVALIAFAAPFLLGLFPRVRLPSVVVEVVAGILVGPDALGWFRVDLHVPLLSIRGLVFLLSLAAVALWHRWLL